MDRSQLQHVILEIGRRFDLSGFHIIGSASILAVLPDAPEGALTATRDVPDTDLCPGRLEDQSCTCSCREVHRLVHGGP